MYALSGVIEWKIAITKIRLILTVIHTKSQKTASVCGWGWGEEGFNELANSSWALPNIS